MRAMERFLVGRHRDELMGEKLSVIQQALLQDRARALIAVAEALADRSQHAVMATRAYIQAAPTRPAPAKPNTPTDPLPLIAASSRGLIALAGTLREGLKTTGSATAVNLKELLPQAQGEATIKVERSRLENAVAGLVSLAAKASNIRIETNRGRAQISVALSTNRTGESFYRTHRPLNPRRQMPAH